MAGVGWVGGEEGADDFPDSPGRAHRSDRLQGCGADDVSSQPWPDFLPVTLLPGWTMNLVLPGHSPFLSYLGR